MTLKLVQKKHPSGWFLARSATLALSFFPRPTSGRRGIALAPAPSEKKPQRGCGLAFSVPGSTLANREFADPRIELISEL